jgi:hypothetical protein
MSGVRGRSGRKRKPTYLKLVTGTARKSRLNPAEPKPEPALPSPPEHLMPEALAEWERVAGVGFGEKSPLAASAEARRAINKCASPFPFQQLAIYHNSAATNSTTPVAIMKSHPLGDRGIGHEDGFVSPEGGSRRSMPATAESSIEIGRQGSR